MTTNPIFILKTSSASAVAKRKITLTTSRKNVIGMYKKTYEIDVALDYLYLWIKTMFQIWYYLSIKIMFIQRGFTIVLAYAKTENVQSFQNRLYFIIHVECIHMSDNAKRHDVFGLFKSYSHVVWFSWMIYIPSDGGHGVNEQLGENIRSLKGNARMENWKLSKHI